MRGNDRLVNGEIGRAGGSNYVYYTGSGNPKMPDVSLMFSYQARTSAAPLQLQVTQMLI